MSMYESEHTRFMREWLALHPEELEVQRQGRALWWDKPQSLDTRKAYLEVEVPARPYAYQSDL